MFRKRNPKVGASPGTLVIPKRSPEPRVHVIRYAEDSVTERDAEDTEHVRG